MPAPLDVDREQVRMLVLSVGVREAARQCGINEKTVLHWSHTGNWLAFTRPEAKPELPMSMQPRSVGSVTPVKALENSLADHSKRTRYALATAVTTGAEHAAQLDGPQLLKSARAVKELAGTAAILHSWDAGSSNLRIDVFAHQPITEPEMPVIDV